MAQPIKQGKRTPLHGCGNGSKGIGEIDSGVRPLTYCLLLFGKRHFQNFLNLKLLNENNALEW